jgi:hypothetical protein
MDPSTLREFGRGEGVNELFAREWFDGLVTTVSLLLIQHWFPWPRKLHRLETYTLGIGAILAGVYVWMQRAGCIEQWVELFVFCVISGVVVCASYFVDWLLKQRVKNLVKNGRD